MSDFKVGDRVKVTIEGVVRSHTGTPGNTFILKFQNEFGNASHTVYTNQSDVTVEKIEPPVETFKPGDVVRHKANGWLKALSSEGYTNLGGCTRGQTFKYGVLNGGFDRESFTSEFWEKVSIE